MRDGAQRHANCAWQLLQRKMAKDETISSSQHVSRATVSFDTELNWDGVQSPSSPAVKVVECVTFEMLWSSR